MLSTINDNYKKIFDELIYARVFPYLSTLEFYDPNFTILLYSFLKQVYVDYLKFNVMAPGRNPEDLFNALKTKMTEENYRLFKQLIQFFAVDNFEFHNGRFTKTTFVQYAPEFYQGQ